MEVIVKDGPPALMTCTQTVVPGLNVVFAVLVNEVAEVVEDGVLDDSAA